VSPAWSRSWVPACRPPCSPSNRLSPLPFSEAHTYSIVAWDSATGDLGVAVQSKFPIVGGIVPWARAGVGAIATQSLTNIAYGERGLVLLCAGGRRPTKRSGSSCRPIRCCRTARWVSWTRAAPRRASPALGHSTGPAVGSGAAGRRGRFRGKGQSIMGRGYAAQANIMVSDRTVTTWRRP
jgi:hypothetical protein